MPIVGSFRQSFLRYPDRLIGKALKPMRPCQMDPGPDPLCVADKIHVRVVRGTVGKAPLEMDPSTRGVSNQGVRYPKRPVRHHAGVGIRDLVRYTLALLGDEQALSAFADARQEEIQAARILTCLGLSS